MLLQSEYDQAYFEGALTEAQGGVAHPAGYSSYASGSLNIEGSTGLSLWEDRAEKMISSAALTGQVIAEFGCAYGDLVAGLVARGVDAYGLDWSAYAIAQARARPRSPRPFFRDRASGRSTAPPRRRSPCRRPTARDSAGPMALASPRRRCLPWLERALSAATSPAPALFRRRPPRPRALARSSRPARARSSRRRRRPQARGRAS